MEQYLILLRPARASFPGDATEQERALVVRHFEHLKRLLQSGELVLAGRTSDEDPIGIEIVEVESRARAEEILRTDPAVAGGVMLGTLRPYSIALERSSSA